MVEVSDPEVPDPVAMRAVRMPDMDADDDLMTRFILSRSGVRGAIVRLGESWQQIAGRGSYPPSLQAWLGEMAAASALLTSQIKTDGRLAIQLKSTGALRTLFADCSQQGSLRGIALFEPPLPDPLEFGQLGPGTMLAITIERAPHAGDAIQRYQGLVDVRAPSLSKALEGYFAQSEQLPTRMLLACAGERAAGLMVQQLPGGLLDADGWTRAQALFDTLGREELLATPADLMLHRLFHEEEPELLSRQALAFGCSCSRQRVGDVLLALGPEQAESAIEDASGEVQVICEFCGQHYRFDRIDLEQLFAGGGTQTGSAKQPN